EAEIKLALSQANARRAFNKAAKKAGKERRAAEKLESSKVKERKLPSNSVAEKASNKTTAKNSAGKTKRKKSGSRKKKKPIPLYRRVLSLMIKVSIFALGLIIVFGYIFGLSRNQSLNMQPAFQDGDLILYLRTYNSYSANDTVLILYDDKTMLERVIAVAGDTVDITEAGLMVNGGLVQESYAWGETTQFKDGVTFPLTVPEGKIFVLGDNREHATDSRVLGCIDERDVSGSVIGSFRRRNF
ncbi:MAG: signal peptidase I, partial [Clostridia bacterium]|nr:signal peptidase I [Clostridia bacterium]